MGNNLAGQRKADKYITELSRVVQNLENVCGLNMKNSSGVEYRSLTVPEILEFCIETCASVPPQSLKELSKIAGKQTAKVTVINSRLSYYGKRKLNFEGYPLLSDIAKTLLKCTSKALTGTLKNTELQRMVTILSEIEKKDTTIKNTLSFRYLRVFLCLILYQSFYNAGVISDFLIKQMSTE